MDFTLLDVSRDEPPPDADDPTVTNVYRGGVPTQFAKAHIPHDGFLADFLMRNKGFIQS